MTGKIRVMQLGSPTGLYGAERWILALARHLDPVKTHSIVAAIKDEPDLDVPLCHEAEKLGCETHVFEAYGKFNLSAVGMLREFIKENDIDILHTHFYKTDLLGLLAVQGTPCKIISTPHGWSKNMDFKLWCYEMMDRGLFLFMDKVVPLSHELKESLEKILGLSKRLYLIENGVDISEIEAQVTINEEIKKYRSSNRFVLGYIGQLISRKGLDVLLEALGTLKNLPWELFLIGEGESRAELTKQAEQLKIGNRVHFMGFWPDRLAFLKGFDAFILPSHLEGIPRCLMEAMAAGVPVVASDIPGCRDLIIDKKTGILFPPGDAKGLSMAIKKLVSDHKLREKLADNARKVVSEKFSARRMAKEYQELYARLIS